LTIKPVGYLECILKKLSLQFPVDDQATSELQESPVVLGQPLIADQYLAELV